MVRVGAEDRRYAVTKSKSVDGKGSMIHAKFLCEYVSCG